MADNDNGNGWSKWENAVLNEQTRQSKAILDLTDKVNGFILTQSIEITKIKSTAGFYGAIAGAIPATVAIILHFLH